MKILSLVIVLLVFSFKTVFAQNPSYDEKLYYTCKVWGFVKYFHSEVSECKVNWDSVLIKNLPGIKSAVTRSDFNDSLLKMISAAGPMKIPSTLLPDTIPAELKRNRDFSWINSAIFDNSIVTLLNSIKTNFIPHPNCWVTNGSSSSGWLYFPHDALMLDKNIFYILPNEEERILLLFKYWNVARYFNPYNYALDQSRDTTLYQNTLQFADASTPDELASAIKKMSSLFNDAHAELLTYNATQYTRIQYRPDFLVRYVHDSGIYVVVQSTHPNIQVGDAILSVDGLTAQNWEDSMRPYVSAGNDAVFRRTMCKLFLAGPLGSTAQVTYLDKNGTIQSTTAVRKSMTNTWYPNDTLSSIKWTTLNCDIGYVNMDRLSTNDVNSMYADLQNKPVIIFDIRVGAHNTAWPIADLMFANKTLFAKDMNPDLNYPGTYTWFYHELGKDNNPSPYKGKVIILVNEQTQSHYEYSCMILEAGLDAIKVGSQTAGADGNISNFYLTSDTRGGFTTVGVFYPNGDSTQRIGIVPDSMVYPTQAGIRAGRDEVLEKAISIACNLSVPNLPFRTYLKIYPNPATDVLNLQAENLITEKIQVTITDINGRIISQTDAQPSGGNIDTHININSLPAGLYMAKIRTGKEVLVQKFIKQ